MASYDRAARLLALLALAAPCAGFAPGVALGAPPRMAVGGVTGASPVYGGALARVGGGLRRSLVMSGSATASGEGGEAPAPLSVPKLAGDTPMANCVVNLMKNIVGSGVLCLAGGVAVMTDTPAMVIVGLGVALAFSLIAGYCFALVGRVSKITGAQSYTEGWALTVGDKSKWIPNVIVVFKTWSACLIYSMIIGDLFTDLAATAGITKLAGVAVNRNSIIFTSHLFGLLPLCLLRSFKVLSYASFLGIGGLIFTAFFMILRLVEGSYAPGGVFFKQLVAKGGKKLVVSSFNVAGTQAIKALILISMLTNSYLCHYNSPKFLRELKDATTKRFSQMTYTSFIGAFVMNALFMVGGFLTFGGASKGLILNNYATTDALATVSRGAIGLSILFGYPLTFEGFRSSATEFAKVKEPSQKLKDIIAVGFIASVCAGAMVLRDLGVVVSFLGALLGSFVIYVFPSMMYRGARRKELEQSGNKDAALGTDYHAAGALIGLGTFLGLLGATVVVLKACTNVLK
eukprot:CAMPEP_0206238452 /NCGR_PEP_ID=MMETSP0047_2-20121206/14827_1 /ASSEMBLY_ACC=CAM_ASM_000192 /TAXON_ID=195065 /ORGANISM="Chroomonas mesostigmatica_cf, Strain CCMP1168" /LENGTH=515 /DNA_ID=CAMNT_0053662997 /DNA_START=70 /DNA_END=1618 /DNA_ORIENTATION=+